MYKWIRERWGIERVKISEGVIHVNSLQEAKQEVTQETDTHHWGNWEEEVIFVSEDDRVAARCVTKEGLVDGKLETISLWRER